MCALYLANRVNVISLKNMPLRYEYILNGLFLNTKKLNNESGKTPDCGRNHKIRCGSCEPYLLATYELPVLVRTDVINLFSTTTLNK